MPLGNFAADAETKIQKLRLIYGELNAQDPLRLVLDELITLYNNPDFLLVFKQGNTAGPLYSDSQLIGCEVNYNSSVLHNFVHEMTHASVLNCYRADMINYYSGNIAIPLEFGPLSDRTGIGSSRFIGLPENVMPPLTGTLDARQRARINPAYNRVLAANLRALKQIATKEHYYKSSHQFKSDEQIKAIADTLAESTVDSAPYFLLVTELQLDAGLIDRSANNKENKINLNAEITRRRNWVIERINYGLGSMVGNVDTEYDTIINQTLLQLHQWGLSTTPNELVTAFGKLAREAHERRMSADNNGLHIAQIRQPRGFTLVNKWKKPFNVYKSLKSR